MNDNSLAVLVEDVRKRFKSYETQHGHGILSSIRRQYIIKQALNGASFSVRKGEIVALLGKNGSGKSTMIKILTGVLHPDSGTVSVLGMDPWVSRELLAMRIGVVFGAHEQLYWNLPALDTFQFRKALYGIPDGEFEKRVRYLVHVLELEKVYKRQVRELSLGERMKCNFAASLLHMPEVVFLDEPTIGVDLPSSFALRDALFDMNKRFGTTFIIATHIIDDIKILAKRTIILDKGNIIYDGTNQGISKMFGDYREVTAYLKGNSRLPLLHGIKMLERTKDYIKFSIPGEMIKDKRLGTFLSSDKVADYSIAEPDFGTTLRQFYKKRASHHGSKD